MLLPLCLLFDIKDTHHDQQVEIHTIATRYNFNTNIRIINKALLLQIISALILILYNYKALGIANLVTAIATYSLIKFFQKRLSNELFQILVVDGMMFVYVIIYYIYQYY